MKKIIIAAVSRNNVIGYNNSIPWNNPEELHHFKETTINHIVLMGRKTFESIGNTLKDRVNIVLSKKDVQLEQFDNLFHFTTLQSAIKYADDLQDNKIFIIGGSDIYAQTIDIADELLISRMPFEINGNRYFPKISNKSWMLKEKINMQSFVLEKYT
ncbi:MAG: dihydrofolate reductase, partial [Melioribacteraceae bacterium]|nr:dihydrofolate reductase [Melioribacteraceae bacterium]